MPVQEQETGRVTAEAIAKVESWVRETLDQAGSMTHGWLHTERVRGHIRVLARAEGVDPILAELAALLHDVGRSQPGPEAEHGARSAALAEPILAELSLNDADREAVLDAIRWHNSKRNDTSLLCVLRDADMLDGLGAVGIVRAFMSRSNLLPYDPGAPFDGGGDRWPARYSSDQLLGQMKWYDWLNTATAREIASSRIRFMKAFVAQVQQELLQDD
ncbi:MAG: HD domain-containing protein [Anaerolineae bacterium]|jgi:HD superfamily phosphodiesterase